MSLALLVTGAAGQLGSDLLRAVRGRRHIFARGLTSRQLDVTDPFDVEDVLREWARVLRADSPEHRLVVANAAAWTDVDAAEDDEQAAYAVNATAPALLARTCARIGAGLLHVSTDYVFAGDACRPYEVDDEPAPLTAYGRTKLAGEQAVRLLLPDASWVVRTAWLYGDQGRDFVGAMRRREAERDVVDVVDDQTGSPTSSAELASALLALAASDVPAGTYHCTNRGETTWYGFARAIFAELGADPDRVVPTTTDAAARRAPRPAYSVLSPASWDDAGLPSMPTWRQALASFFVAPE